MGLGLMGGGLGDAKFLLDCGASLTITDLKSEVELKPSLKKLSKYKNIKYTLGEHKLEDFRNADFIIQPGNVPPDSIYLAEARKNNIPIYESESLFLEQAEGIKVVGVTGTRGKTTTTTLIYEILKTVFKKKVHLGGNIRGTSALSLLAKIKAGDVVVMELDSWCLHGIGEVLKSPQISVFTNIMPDHLNFYLKGSKDQAEALQKYFMDKANIYLNQKPEDYLICGAKIAERIGEIKSHKIVVTKNSVSKAWKIKIPGEHNLENIACAVAVARILKIEEKIIKKAVEKFTGVDGRLQFVKEYKGIKIYNDTTATTPDATLAALRALGPTSHQNASRDKIKKIILILGGADKNLDMSGLLKEIPKYAKDVFLLDGTGSNKINIKNAFKCSSLKEAVAGAIKKCQKGDILLFSPAFASFGLFKNEYDRGDQFNALIKKLK